MLISIGSDHGGFELKIKIITEFPAEFIDHGTFSKSSVDYPKYAKLVVMDILNQKSNFGILICTTGIGMSIAANRYRGIRAALCHNVDSAKKARQHNDSNILILGNYNFSSEILDIFFNTPFEGGRHSNRINQIDEI